MDPPPPEEPLTPLVMFTCTYSANIGGLGRTSPEAMVARLRLPDGLHSTLVGFNSNFGHASAPGWAPSLARRVRVTRADKEKWVVKPRTTQGDGSSFNSSVEIIIAFGGSQDKFYKLKLFTSTGAAQVPGVIREDLSDGHAALEELCVHLRRLGWPEAQVLSEKVTMLNFKFAIRLAPREVLVAGALEDEFFRLQEDPGAEGAPPFRVVEARPTNDIGKISASFRTEPEVPHNTRFNIFQGGKVNVLGALSAPAVRLLYGWFRDLFRGRWHEFVGRIPLTDAELRELEAQKIARDDILARMGLKPPPVGEAAH